MRRHNVRVIIYDSDDEVVANQDFDVTLSEDYDNPDQHTTFDEVFAHLANREVDFAFINSVKTSHTKILNMLEDVQSLLDDLLCIFHSGNYADLLLLQDRLKKDKSFSKALIQEARLLDMANLFKKMDK